MSNAAPPLPDCEQISSSARWLVQAIDPGRAKARLVEMSPADYVDASFLDDRLFTQQRTAHVVEWTTLVAAAEQVPSRTTRWIFHLGHVGSTLLSRLLGELGGVLAVREPRSLRDVALLPPEQRARFLPSLATLLGRSFGSDQFAMVKATSFVSEIAPELVGEEGKAILLRVDPRSYIQTILAGENSRKELAVMSSFRLERMQKRVPGSFDLARFHDAERAALAWACEATALEAAAEQIGADRVLWMDFDLFLANVPAGLARAAAHFGLSPGADTLRELANGPLMRRYSKAPEYDYTPQLRRDLQQESQELHGAAIERSLAMLRTAAAGSPLLRRALDRAVEY